MEPGSGGPAAGGGMVCGLDGGDVSRWFGECRDAFAACGRGESDTASLLGTGFRYSRSLFGR